MSGFIQNLLKGMGEDKKEIKEKFKEAQQNQKVERMLEERDKSSNQRFLERHFKEQKEKKFKEEVDKINKQHTKDSWKGNSFLKGHTSILKDDKTALKSDDSSLSSKNIFMDNKINNPFMGQGGMFLK